MLPCKRVIRLIFFSRLYYPNLPSLLYALISAKRQLAHKYRHLVRELPAYAGIKRQRKRVYMSDILFQRDNQLFSYRVAGICMQNRQVLLQRPEHDPGYAFPGGHGRFRRDERGNAGARIQRRAGRADYCWRFEMGSRNFLPLDGCACQQICLYYQVELRSALPRTGCFRGAEALKGQNPSIQFHWVPIDQLKNSQVILKTQLS